MKKLVFFVMDSLLSLSKRNLIVANVSGIMRKRSLVEDVLGMRGKRLLFVVFISVFAYSWPIQAQVKKSLAIGEVVPDIQFDNVINNESPSIRLSDYRDRIVVLDFWNYWCAPCIEAFPKYDSLQKLYGDKLKVILVTYEEKNSVKEFWKKNPYAKKVSLPVITNDSLLHKLFDVTVVPQIVWIGKDGKLAAYTDNDYLQKNKIEQIIHGSAAQWVVNKKIGFFDYSRPFLQPNETLPVTPILYYSAFTGYLPGIKSKSDLTADSSKGILRWFISNQDIPRMSRIFMGMTGLDLHPRQVLMLVKDSMKLVENNALEYTDAKSLSNYTYEGIAPINTSKERLRASYLDDLNRYTGLYARFEEQALPCYVLMKKKAVKEPVAGPNDLYMGLEELVHMWSGLPGKTLIKNESGTNEKIHFPQYKTFDEVRAGITAYGFSLEPAVRKTTVLVISDKPF